MSKTSDDLTIRREKLFLIELLGDAPQAGGIPSTLAAADSAPVLPVLEERAALPVPLSARPRFVDPG